MSCICNKFDTLGFDNPSRRYRLGIMGGTFDPIHIGHLACAEQVREALELDAVIFIPTGTPVFKLGQDVAPAEKRLAMCRLAVRSNPFFDVSGIEVERGGNTYTVDTLEQLRAYYPSNVELFFITGADALLSIAKWKNSARIAHLATLVGATRPGYELSDEDKRFLAEDVGFTVVYTQVTALAVSSSSVRERVRSGRSVAYLVPGRVNDFLVAHGLYREGVGDKAPVLREVAGEEPLSNPATADPLSDAFFHYAKDVLKERLKPSRFEHSLSVSKVAAHMAQVYGEDVASARLAGLLHDWDKSLTDDELRNRVREFALPMPSAVVEQMPYLLHGPTAACALAREFPAISENVLQAIARHTSAAVGMTKLDMIVFTADAIEPLRSFTDFAYLRDMVGIVSLEELFFETYRKTIGLLVEKGRMLHPGSAEVMNYYAARARNAR